LRNTTILQFQKRNINLLENLIGNRRGRKRQQRIIDYLIDESIKTIILKCESKLPNHSFIELELCCKDILDTPHSTVKYYETGIPVIRTSDNEPEKIDF